MARKFTSALLNEENEHLPQIIDALNIVLTLMAAMRVPDAWPTKEAKEEIGHLITKLRILKSSSLDHRAQRDKDQSGVPATRG